MSNFLKIFKANYQANNWSKKTFFYKNSKKPSKFRKILEKKSIKCAKFKK